jgi:hypothetical protein
MIEKTGQATFSMLDRKRKENEPVLFSVLDEGEDRGRVLKSGKK